MGVIDKTIHSLKCSCGESESVAIIQHGSAYGGSWQSSKPMAQFAVTWGESDGFSGPRITSATCNTCGAVPEISMT